MVIGSCGVGGDGSATELEPQPLVTSYPIGHRVGLGSGQSRSSTGKASI